jgi:tetraacyldisaccharide 4'-kinase
MADRSIKGQHGPFVLLLTRLLYGPVTALNRWLFSVGIRRVRRLPVPVVSVGNVTVGGTGKTPLVIWLAEQLAGSGYRVAVLSRGYGRSGKTTVEVPRASAAKDRMMNWKQYGDEPVMIRNRLPEVPVFLSPDRFDAGMAAMKADPPDLFILDDGFQHYGLHRDLDVVLVDAGRGLGSGRLLPGGILREPAMALARAGAVVVTKMTGEITGLKKELAALTTAPVIGSRLVFQGLEAAHGPDTSGHPGETGPFHALTGIADPDSFLRTAREAGVAISGHTSFPDHHPFAGRELEKVVSRAVDEGAAAVVTTEKDAVRLPAEIGLTVMVLKVDPVLDGDGKELLTMIRDIMPSDTVRSPE